MAPPDRVGFARPGPGFYPLRPGTASAVPGLVSFYGHFLHLPRNYRPMQMNFCQDERLIAPSAPLLRLTLLFPVGYDHCRMVVQRLP